jgi:hypothetical protein
LLESAVQKRGKLHARLNMATRPIANKYREGKLQRTLKRELKGRETSWKETGGAAMQSTGFSLRLDSLLVSDRKTLTGGVVFVVDAFSVDERYDRLLCANRKPSDCRPRLRFRCPVRRSLRFGLQRPRIDRVGLSHGVRCLGWIPTVDSCMQVSTTVSLDSHRASLPI